MYTIVITDRNLLDLTIGSIVAIITGGSIDLDRYIQHKVAGLRTQML